MADKLAIFNSSLYELGHAPLASLTEGIEAQRVLTRLWERVVEDCLSEASWNFAMRTVMFTADPDYDPQFGFTKVFEKPEDFVRLTAISADEHFSFPLLHYFDDGDHWAADVDPIYMRYVSNGDEYGWDLSRWPAPFTRYVELELAARAAIKISQGEGQKDRVEKDRDDARKKAKNIDALDQAQPTFPPPSGWTTSRWGRFGGRERGRRGSLIG